MLTLASTDAVIGSLAGAKDVAVEAYTIRGPLVRALERAARGGTRVSVCLEGEPVRDRNGALHERNAELVAELRGAGADARLQSGIHAKAIDVDGTLYLDEKNWNRGDLVVRAGDPGDRPAIAATKAAALAQEAALLARVHDAVIVESESFGAGNAVYAALKALGKAGASPRLLVARRDLRDSPSERAALERLASSGVRVRVCADSTKAAVAGDTAWLGSANATYCGGGYDMADWGVCTGDGSIVGAVRARLESQWRTARQFKP